MSTAPPLVVPAFWHAHATHPDPHMALALAAAQIDAQIDAQAGAGLGRATLGWIYLSDRYAPQAEALLAELQQRWPTAAWVGTTGVSICASGVEYDDEPALVLMLAALPAGSFTLYSGEHGLPADAQAGDIHTALVHADGHVPELAELIHELAGRTASGYLFGGLAASRTRAVQFCAPAPGSAWRGGVYEGGVSGVAFGAGVGLISRVTQGCQPVGPSHRITACEQNVVLELDGEPALDVLLRELGVTLDEPRRALPVLRATLAGLSDAADESLSRGGQFGADTRVRHLIGLDPARLGFAVADRVDTGMRLAFCQRHVEAARRDLVRICAEIREELCPDDPDAPPDLSASADDPAARIAGAIYVSCNGRGGAHFGAPSAELELIRHALGDVPLVGFFAGGEIARHHLYGYTGVLTVFTRRP
ncbi:FIST signal transduction protein [Leptothrix sp. BB-4]